MTLLKGLLKWCLGLFYPRNSITLDGEHYKGKEERYTEKLDSNYVNGKWYINESIPSIVSTVDRSIKYGSGFYLISNTNNYSFAFAVEGFRGSQEMNITVVFDEDLMENYYTARLFDSTSKYMYTAFNDNITWDNIKKIRISADELISNYIKYTGVDEIILENPQLVLLPISREEFTNIKNNSEYIYQKIPKSLQCMNYKNSETNFGLRLRNFLWSNYIDSHQELKVTYKNITETVKLNDVQINDSHNVHWTDDKITIDGLGERPTENIEILLEMEPYQDYSGFKVKIIFDSINGNSYTDVSSIEYQV